MIWVITLTKYYLTSLLNKNIENNDIYFAIIKEITGGLRNDCNHI